MITFTCKGRDVRHGNGKAALEILQRGNPCEAELCAREKPLPPDRRKAFYGNYLCIPNWDVGTELSSLTDLFWNEERLRHYSRMKKADACTIVSALKVLAEHGCNELIPFVMVAAVRPITKEHSMTDILAIS